MEFNLITDLTTTAQYSVCTSYVPSVLKSPHIYISYFVDMCTLQCSDRCWQLCHSQHTTAWDMYTQLHKVSRRYSDFWDTLYIAFVGIYLLTSLLTHEKEVFNLLLHPSNSNEYKVCKKPSRHSRPWRFQSSGIWHCVVVGVPYNYTTSHLRRPQPSAAPLWEPRNLHSRTCHS